MQVAPSRRRPRDVGVQNDPGSPHVGRVRTRRVLRRSRPRDFTPSPEPVDHSTWVPRAPSLGIHSMRLPQRCRGACFSPAVLAPGHATSPLSGQTPCDPPPVSRGSPRFAKSRRKRSRRPSTDPGLGRCRRRAPQLCRPRGTGAAQASLRSPAPSLLLANRTAQLVPPSALSDRSPPLVR